MKISFSYQGYPDHLDIPDTMRCVTLAPREVPITESASLLAQCLADPIASVLPEEFLSGSEKPLIIVNDATRPTPTTTVLRAFAGILKQISPTFLVATGTHRKPTEKELSAIFGEYLKPFRQNIHVHDARDATSLVTIGELGDDGVITLNRHVLEADRIITINSVEPHYFAGYTGGRKSFFPGVAGYTTIERNHRHALSADARPLNLDDNPVHDGMVRSMGLLEKQQLFSVQMVLDRTHQIYSAFCGNMEQCFRLAVKDAEYLFSSQTEGKADIVVVLVQPPKNLNLYQVQNALENGKRVLKNRGILIFQSTCHDGIGPDTFHKLLAADVDRRELLAMIAKEYKLGYHKAIKWKEILTAAEIWGVSQLPPETLTSIGVRPFPSLQQAVDAAVARKGTSCDMLFLPDGDKTVPQVQSQRG